MPVQVRNSSRTRTRGFPRTQRRPVARRGRSTDLVRPTLRRRTHPSSLLRKMLHLSALTSDSRRAALYRSGGERITQSLIDRYLTPVTTGDATPPGVLRHGSSTRPNAGMTIYGDYYLLETLIWLPEHTGRQGK